MNRRQSQRLLHACRAALMLGSVIALGIAAVWHYRPQWVHGVDEALQRAHVRGAEERLQRGIALLADDRTGGLRLLTALSDDLMDVRRGDRLEAVAAQAHWFSSRVHLEDGAGDDAVRRALAVTVLDPQNVDGLVNLAEVRFAAGQRREALAELQLLHGRIPHSERITALLVRLGLEEEDHSVVTQAVRRHEGATRSNRWTVSYVLRDTPLRDFHVLRQGLLVPRRMPDGRLAFAFLLEGPVERLRVTLPPDARMRLIDPRLVVRTGERTGTGTGPVPSPQLLPVADGFHAQGRTKHHLDWSFGDLAASTRHAFEFSVRVEAVLAAPLVDLLGGPTGDGILQRFAEQGPEADHARLRKYRLARLAEDGLRLSWAEHGADFDASHASRTRPLLTVNQDGLSFRARLPLDGPADRIRLQLPPGLGVTWRLARVAIGAGEPLAPDGTHDVRVEQDAVVVTGPDPRIEYTVGDVAFPTRLSIQGELR